MVKSNTVLFLLMATLLFSSACGLIPESFSFEASPTPTAVRNVLAPYQPRQTAAPILIPPTATPLPAPPAAPQTTPTAMIVSQSSPTAAPTLPSGDGFCCLHFASGPFAQAAETFPAGTEIIYAIWDYKGLSQDDRVRRIWIRDNLIWITREETWDWENYGATGTVRDLSIFDYEGSGLESAEYRLQLYLNDVLQQERAFVILPP